MLSDSLPVCQFHTRAWFELRTRAEYYLQQNTVICRSRGELSAHEKGGNTSFTLAFHGNTRTQEMGHFRVAVSLGFEVSLGAQLVLNYKGNEFDLHKNRQLLYI